MATLCVVPYTIVAGVMGPATVQVSNLNFLSYMKRQLNFWSKPVNAPNTDPVNVSLSVKDTQFNIVFRRPGSVEPITELTVNVDDVKTFELRRAFEAAGCSTFQDEMDERIYFNNIARSREGAQRAEHLGIAVGCAAIIYIACMVLGILLFKMHSILVLVFSLFITISSIILIKRKLDKKIS